MLGLRGFPHVQGGIEKHAEHLCPLLKDLGIDMNVIVRSRWMPEEVGDGWRGVRFRRLWSPKGKGVEALIHTFLGVLHAGFLDRPDILHIHAVGPALMTPLARLLGLRVVVTHHGADYNRKKWGRFARWVLRTGERLGMKFANGRIVLSEEARQMVAEKYGRHSHLIPNGVDLPDIPSSTGALDRFGLDRDRYVLLVSRLVPEKRHLDLIAAFEKAKLDGWKLVLVGSSDHPDDYTRKLDSVVQSTHNVIATGFQSGLALQELFAHAGIFVLPSCHEGLSIALLEALSYGLPVIASDIPANLQFGLDPEHYYPVGNVDELAGRLRTFASQPFSEEKRERTRQWLVEKHDWRDIARQTAEAYQAALR